MQFKCPACDFVSNTFEKFTQHHRQQHQQHQQLHQNGGAKKIQFKCPACDFISYTFEKFTQHHQQQHQQGGAKKLKNNVKNKLIKNLKNKYACPICNSYKHDSDFMQHFIKHHYNISKFFYISNEHNKKLFNNMLLKLKTKIYCEKCDKFVDESHKH